MLSRFNDSMLTNMAITLQHAVQVKYTALAFSVVQFIVTVVLVYAGLDFFAYIGSSTNFLPTGDLHIDMFLLSSLFAFTASIFTGLSACHSWCYFITHRNNPQP